VEKSGKAGQATSDKVIGAFSLHVGQLRQKYKHTVRIRNNFKSRHLYPFLINNANERTNIEHSLSHIIH